MRSVVGARILAVVGAAGLLALALLVDFLKCFDMCPSGSAAWKADLFIGGLALCAVGGAAGTFFRSKRPALLTMGAGAVAAALIASFGFGSYLAILPAVLLVGGGVLRYSAE